MIIEAVTADAFGTKCYVLAPGPGSECVVVDPGIRVRPRLDAVLERHDLHPVAVLMTHGHLDHTWSVTPVCTDCAAPAYVHPGDADLLKDPFAGLGNEFGPQFREAVGPGWEWAEPDDVRSLDDGTVLDLAGLRIEVEHAPGHTPGSVLFNLPGDRDSTGRCLVGDVLYAGTIGRTDMPGGSREQTLRSLKEKILPKPDDTVLLTGHGRDTTVGEERHANPFMRQAIEWSPTPSAQQP